MKKKTKPSPPNWIWEDELDDDCYWCKHKSNCRNCPVCKRVVAEKKKKKRKWDDKHWDE